MALGPCTRKPYDYIMEELNAGRWSTLYILHVVSYLIWSSLSVYSRYAKKTLQYDFFLPFWHFCRGNLRMKKKHCIFQIYHVGWVMAMQVLLFVHTDQISMPFLKKANGQYGASFEQTRPNSDLDHLFYCRTDQHVQQSTRNSSGHSPCAMHMDTGSDTDECVLTICNLQFASGMATGKAPHHLSCTPFFACWWKIQLLVL